MLNRLKFPLALLTLLMFAAWAPSRLNAQSGTNQGQQGEFQGEHTDTGAAAVDKANEKEAPGSEASETAAGAAAAARAPLSAASSRAAEVADSEASEKGPDLDRIEDQVGDQTATDPLPR